VNRDRLDAGNHRPHFKFAMMASTKTLGVFKLPKIVGSPDISQQFRSDYTFSLHEGIHNVPKDRGMMGLCGVAGGWMVSTTSRIGFRVLFAVTEMSIGVQSVPLISLSAIPMDKSGKIIHNPHNNATNLLQTTGKPELFRADVSNMIWSDLHRWQAPSVSDFDVFRWTPPIKCTAGVESPIQPADGLNLPPLVLA
jgi:hypothetical protein